MMINQVYVINLERRPDRLAHFHRECEREGIPNQSIRVWKAVDGMSHTLSPEERTLFEHSDLDPNTETGKGCIANQLSHLQVMRDIISEESKVDVALVFQDDVRLGKDFWKRVNTVAAEMRTIPNSSFVFVGFHAIGAGSYFVDYDLEKVEENLFWTEQLTPHIGRLHPEINPASLAFLVTKEGARAYLNHIDRFGILHATDRNQNGYLIERNQFLSTFPVLCTGNSQFKSDIFKYDEHAVTRDLLELLEDL